MSIFTVRRGARGAGLAWVRPGKMALIVYPLSRAPGETMNTNQVPPAALKAWHIRSGQGQPGWRVGSATSFPGWQVRQEHWLIEIVVSVPGPCVVLWAADISEDFVIGPTVEGGPKGLWLCMWGPRHGQARFSLISLCLGPKLAQVVGSSLIFIMECRRVRLPERGRASGE